jgi:hypothetical protein
MNRDKFMIAVRYRALEQFEAQRRERAARVIWFEQALERWDYDRQTWEQFADTPLGRPLARRARWVLRKPAA